MCSSSPSTSSFPKQAACKISFASVRWRRKINLFAAFTWTTSENSLFFYWWEGNGYTHHTQHCWGWPRWTMTAATVVASSLKRRLLFCTQLCYISAALPWPCLWPRCLSLSCSWSQLCPCSPLLELTFSRNLVRVCAAWRDARVRCLSSPCSTPASGLLDHLCHASLSVLSPASFSLPPSLRVWWAPQQARCCPALGCWTRHGAVRSVSWPCSHHCRQRGGRAQLKSLGSFASMLVSSGTARLKFGLQWRGNVMVTLAEQKTPSNKQTKI